MHRKCRWTSALCLFVCLAAPAFPQTAGERQRRGLDTAYYKKWLTEDVSYIISAEERTVFKSLQTDAAREQFVEQFWRRRDPTPDTVENEYREEYYRRLTYANEQFAAGVPGWMTDRGHIYIKYGPPDERAQAQGSGTLGAVPYERWHYRSMGSFATNVDLEFVDAAGSGEFRLNLDPQIREALLGPGPRGADVVAPPKMSLKLQPPPVTKFQDLEAAVNAAAKVNLLPMQVQTDFIPVTGSSVLSNLTIQFERKDLQFQQKGEISSAAVNLYARITSLQRRPATWFEDVISVDVPTSKMQQALAGAASCSTSVPLQPGRYRLNIAAKDTASGKTTSFETIWTYPARIAETGA